jgi:hypothetical protein
VADSKPQNELILHTQGQEISGHGPENTPLRFWAEGDKIVGELRDPDGNLHKIAWEWIETGQTARLRVRDQGGQDKSLLLRRGPVALAQTTTPECILYQMNHDLNGDGQSESAQIVALDNNPEPNAASRKVLRIQDAHGSLQFESEPFEEPFHTDIDSVAESAQEKAGLHLLPGSPFPRIRLIFASHSGNFVDFHFNGKEYVLAEIGD